jgi:RNA polymerase sigma-70 factor (ECF subfamily)
VITLQDLDAIYREHADTVYRFLLAKTGSAQLAEELTQETFFQAVSSIDRYDGSCRISTWLCAIAKNVLYSYYKKRKQEVSLEEIEEPQAPSAEETALSSLSQQEILKRIHAVPDPGREILHLRLLGGLSFRQIGEIMSQTETWARVNYYRAKQTLVKELKTHEEYKE